LLACSAMAALTYSCKKETAPDPPAPAPPSPYIQLAEGNYWVYQLYDIDAAGNETPRNETDSCYIEKDTIIHGHTYFKLVKLVHYAPYKEIHCLRDSLSYLINSYGARLFATTDFTNDLGSYTIIAAGDTISRNVRRMDEADAVVATPFGLFTTLNAKTTIYMYPPYTTAGAIRYMNASYAPQVGLVIETIQPYLSSPAYVERRLLRYHIQ
jgi:hypothetical protein